MYDLYKEFNGCFKIYADTNGLKSIKSMTVGFWMAILIILIMDILHDSQLGSRPLDDGDTTAAIKNAVYLQTIGPTKPHPTPSPHGPKLSQFHAIYGKFDKIVKSYVGTPRPVGAPPTGNPGSAPVETTIATRGGK